MDFQFKNNQKFRCLRQRINEGKIFEKQQFGQNSNEIRNIKNSEIIAYPSVYNSVEDSKYSNIDYNLFKDSALLANEKRKPLNIREDKGMNKGLKNYQSVADLKTDRVFKNAALKAFDRPPLRPKLPQMGRRKQSFKKNEKPINSLRRSNTYKNLKKASEIDRVSAPLENIYSGEKEDFSLEKEMERIQNARNFPLPTKSISIPYQKYQEYPDINPQVKDQDFRPLPMPRFSNLKQNNDYFADKNNKR